MAAVQRRRQPSRQLSVPLDQIKKMQNQMSSSLTKMLALCGADLYIQEYYYTLVDRGSKSWLNFVSTFGSTSLQIGGITHWFLRKEPAMVDNQPHSGAQSASGGSWMCRSGSRSRSMVWCRGSIVAAQSRRHCGAVCQRWWWLPVASASPSHIGLGLGRWEQRRQ